MDLEHELKELKKIFEMAHKQSISPITAMAIVDKENAAKAKDEYEKSIDDFYKDVLANAYGGDTNFMARSLLGYICSLSVRGRLSQMPKDETVKTGRPATSWGENGEGKLAIYAAVQFEIDKKAEEGINLKIVDALWEVTKLDKNNPSHIRKIKALASAYSEGKAKVINHRASKAIKENKKL